MFRAQISSCFVHLLSRAVKMASLRNTMRYSSRSPTMKFKGTEIGQESMHQVAHMEVYLNVGTFNRQMKAFQHLRPFAIGCLLCLFMAYWIEPFGGRWVDWVVSILTSTVLLLSISLYILGRILVHQCTPIWFIRHGGYMNVMHLAFVYGYIQLDLDGDVDGPHWKAMVEKYSCPCEKEVHCEILVVGTLIDLWEKATGTIHPDVFHRLPATVHAYASAERFEDIHFD